MVVGAAFRKDGIHLHTFMVAIVNKNLLKEVRKLAIRDEFFTMRLRGVLVVVPVVEQPVKKPETKRERLGWHLALPPPDRVMSRSGRLDSTPAALVGQDADQPRPAAP